MSVFLFFLHRRQNLRTLVGNLDHDRARVLMRVLMRCARLPSHGRRQLRWWVRLRQRPLLEPSHPWPAQPRPLREAPSAQLCSVQPHCMFRTARLGRRSFRAHRQAQWCTAMPWSTLQLSRTASCGSSSSSLRYAARSPCGASAHSLIQRQQFSSAGADADADEQFLSALLARLHAPPVATGGRTGSAACALAGTTKLGRKRSMACCV